MVADGDLSPFERSLVRVNKAASELTIYFWIAGLIWTAFISKSAPGVHPLEWLGLAAFGSYGVSLVIAMPLAFLALLLTKLVWRHRAHPPLYIHEAFGFFGAVLAFLLAGPIALWVSTLW